MMSNFIRGKYIFAILLLFISFNSTKACSCIGTSSFCESTFFSSNIALVKVIDKSTPDKYSSFDVEVKEVISGNVSEQKLSINYNPTSCTEFISVSIDDELIINFSTTYEIDEAPFLQ